MIEESKNNGNGSIPQELVDLIEGLEPLNEWNEACPLLDRLELLCSMIDRAVDDECYEVDIGQIISMCYWQKDIISELKRLFDNEERQVSTLKRTLKEAMQDNGRKWPRGIHDPDMKKVNALATLTSLFDKRIGRGYVDGTSLRAWALTHGPDLAFDLAKALFQQEEASEAKPVSKAPKNHEEGTL